MDEPSRANLSAGKFFIKNVCSFEKELKDKLKRNRQQWIDAGESGTKLHKLVNSLHYWKSKLKPALEDKSIIITLFNTDNNVRVELANMIEAIEKLDVGFQVRGISTFRNPRYICLYFDDKEVRDSVVEQFRMLDDNYIVYMHWAFENAENVRSLKVHWLPITFDIEMIKQELSKYVDCIEQERKKISFMSGRDMPVGKIEFKVKLKKDVTAESIPHVMEIGKMEALITITGRSSLCLNCDCLGHISKDCKMRYCSECRLLKPKNHDCGLEQNNRSYATIVKSNILGANVEDLEKWEDNEVIITKPEISENRIILANKIVALENRVKEMNSNHEASISLINEHKRKADDLSAGNEEFSESGSEVDFIEDAKDWANSSDDRLKVCTTDSENMFMDTAHDKETKDGKGKKKTNSGEKKSSVNQKALRKTHGNKQINQNPANISEVDSQSTIKSYGRPVPNNARKREFERKFDKLSEVREFVFKD